MIWVTMHDKQEGNEPMMIGPELWASKLVLLGDIQGTTEQHARTCTWEL